MWERVERTHLLLVFVACIVALCSEYFVAFIISWIAVGFALYNVCTASSLSPLTHWRSIPIYTSNIEFAIVLSIFQRYDKHSVKTAIVAFAIISLVSCAITVLLLYLLPVPSARRLNGKYQHIGTVSFEIPVLTEQIDGPAKKVLMPVQCWYPLAPPSNPLQRIYQTYFQRNSLMWTSGSNQEAQESHLILKQIAHIYAMPSFIFQHLGLARTNSLYQKTPSGLPSSPSSFPIAVYSHGMYGWRTVHHTCCEQLARHGFIVFAPDHSPDAMLSRPVEDLAASKAFDYFLPKGIEGLQERIFYGVGFNRRATDIRALLDFIAPTDLTGAASSATASDCVSGVSQLFPHFKDRLNVKSVHLWGHSFGGGTMSTVIARDNRVTSAVILDGWLYPMPDKERQRGSVNASVLNVSSQLWNYGKYQFPFRKDFIQNTLLNDSTGSIRAFNMVLTGTDHQNYCDVNLTAGAMLLQKKSVLGTERNPFEVMQHVDNLVVGFFKKGDAERAQKGSGVVNGDSNADDPLLTQSSDQSITEKRTGKLNFTTADLVQACTSLDSACNPVSLLPLSTIDYIKKYLVSVEDLNDPTLSDDSVFNRVTKGVSEV